MGKPAGFFHWRKKQCLIDPIHRAAIRHVLYCCSASHPSMEGETKEDEKEVQTEELAIIASALANGYVKAKTRQSGR